MKYGRGKFQLKNLDVEFKASETSLKSIKTVFVGLPQWSIPQWKGTLYTNNCSPRKYLSEYSNKLSSVEVSSTFYTNVSKEMVNKWTSQVGSHFRFLPKWPRKLTHEFLLNIKHESFKNFIQTIESFYHNMGSSFLQLPPNFSTQYKRELFIFLESLPKEIKLCIEFRHPSWFSDQKIIDKLASYLSKKNIGLVILDAPAARDLFHLSFLSKNTIIRYLSDEDESTDQIRLEKWRDYINHSLSYSGEIDFIIHSPNNSRSPELLKYIDDNIIIPSKAPKQEELFSS